MSLSQSLGTRAARGILWTGGASALQLVAILVLYTTLPIADMGRFEYALILIMFLALAGSLGLNAALVQRREVDEIHFSSAFWISLGAGLILAVGVYAVAPPLGRLLGGSSPLAFQQALRVLALILPCAAVSGIFRARLQRVLDFAAVARAELVSVGLFGLYVVPLVLWQPGLGVMIPLTGSVLRELGLLAGLWWESRWYPRAHLSLAAVRSLLPFAVNFTGSRLTAYLNSHIASLYIFPLLGSTAQGYYRLAERLTLGPLIRLSTTISHVSLPTFSSIQDDDARLGRGYLRGVQSLVLFLGPVLVFLIVFGAQVLELLERLPALSVLRLLALATLFKAMGTMAGSAFMAKGRADWLLRWSLFNLAVLIPALYVSTPQGVATMDALFGGILIPARHALAAVLGRRLSPGIEAVAAVVAGTSLLFLVLSQALVNRLISLPLSAYLRALARPAAVVATVLVSCGAARPWLPGTAAAVLVQGAVVAGIAGAMAIRLFAWSLMTEYIHSLVGRAPLR